MSYEEIYTLDLPFEFKADDIDDETGYFKGHAAAFSNLDTWNDVIVPGAFAKTLKRDPVVPVLFYHDAYEPVGISLSMAEDQVGLAVEAELALELQKARDVRVMMKKKIITRLSIGFRADPKKQKFVTERNKQIRYLQEIELLEFSPVVFAANKRAKITSVKAATTPRELERVLREEGRVSIDAAKYIAARFQFPADPSGGGIEAPREVELADEKAMADLLQTLRGHKTIFI